MKFLISPRIGYLAGFLACVGLFAFAVYLQYYEYQNPCPLCILQRVAFIAMMAVFLVAAIHGPRFIGACVYSGLLVAIATAGGAVATRHVWLQHLPKDRVPECGPGLEYMLEKFPLTQALEKIFRGSGECAEVGWTFLGLSIAEWSLVWFVLLAVLAVVIAMAARRQ
ncbi:MAG: disulfide bond formation protein B [Betaproteobacteria bacterium]|nr:disulfide bond formation protein B [Betaproteobacteria bacterium]